VSFCSLIKGITPKICMLRFVLINSLLLNLLCVCGSYILLLLLLLARSILGRWKERSLRMKPPSLPIVQGISRPTKGIRNTFWHTGTQCKNENKGEKPPSQETLQKKKGKSTKEAKGTHKSSTEWIHSKGRRGKMKRKGKKNKRIDMANTENRKEKQEERYNYWTTNKYPCLV